MAERPVVNIPKGKPLPLGTMTKWGRIESVGWVGERYYWMIDKHGCISMMPATDVEKT